MRIEKIELIGFKSFADRTSFVLHPGITCIVGPNGCGKSNIVDAFRWVLGEQSAKSLRGEKMEEVIFNGSSSKKQKGMAEVTLVVAGMNGPGGGNGQGDGDIVSTTRRLYRSGESEYLLNRNQCRLKDIKDLFLDTGLEVRSYSILEQGRIGEILNAKPLDRRFIIEEVAGVMKYKVRKAEALSKLESSRINLVRINDIIAEVKKQINILDRLARKAERYKKLSSEMHAIELKIARREYQQLKDSLETALAEFNSLKARQGSILSDVTEMETRTETRRVALLEKEKSLEKVQERFSVTEKEISGIERSIAVCRNDIANAAEYRGKLIQQEEELDLRRSEVTAKGDELGLNIERLLSEMEAHADDLREKIDALKAIEDEIGDREDLIEDNRRKLFRITEELSSMRNEIGKQQTLLESHERRGEAALRDSEDSRRILSEIEVSVNAVESEIYGRNSEILLLNEKKGVLTRELSESRERLEKMNALLASAREDMASYISRLDSLKEIVFDRPAREMLASEGNINLISTVSEVFDVQEGFEKAIESALAEKSDSFILGSFEDIENAVSSIRKRDAGRTAFMPIAPPPLLANANIPDGAIGQALEFVRVKEEYSGMATNLLAGCLVVKDIRTAFALRADNPDSVFVTLEGDVMEPSGAVMAGKGTGIFQRKREMKELQEMIEEKRSLIGRTAAEIQSLKESIKGSEEEIKNVESSVYGIEKDVSLAKLTIENHMDEKDRISRKLSYLSIEMEEISREKESLKAGIARAIEQAAASEAGKSEVEERTQAVNDEIFRKKSELEQYRSEVTDIKLEAASNRERMEAMRNERESAIGVLEETERKKENLKNEKESVAARISLRENEIAGHEESLKAFVSEADVLRRDISGRKEEIEKESEELLLVDQELRKQRQNLSSVSARVSELDIMRTEQRMKMENLSLNVMNNYGAELESLELGEITAEEEERLLELRKKIEEMGPVNLGTLDEYEEFQKRYEFMTTQREDLNKSIAELEEAISKINSTTRKRLREAFESLKEKFSEVFATLFGGGRAELLLTDESNILETGIDIIAQPPGKRLQNINLLSGGEKALTALALQFASFLIKPTPLCILDEADAPLDESNTERFANMLSELAQKTQFIVVTHNRTTMGVAQHLYGITMEEAGVSKVISMQFAGN